MHPNPRILDILLRWSLVPLSCLLLAACSTVGLEKISDPPVSATAPFERGLMYYVAGNLAQAEKAMAEALRRTPDDWRARDLLQVIQAETERIALSAAPASYTDQAWPSPLTPERLWRKTLGRNPEIRRAVFEVVEARARLREANVSFGPEFSILTRFYPLGLFASLTQSLLRGLLERRALMHEAEANLLRSVAHYAAVREDVLARAFSAYIDSLLARRLVPLLNKELALRQEQIRLAKIQVEFGKMLRHDLLALEGELEKSRERLVELQGRSAVAKATLNGLLGREIEAPLKLVHKDVEVDELGDVQRAVSAAHENRSDIREAQNNVRQARGELEVAKASELPSVQLRSTYGSSIEGGEGDFLEGPSIGVRFRTPLLFLPLRRARTDREAAFVRQLEMEVRKLLGVAAVEVVNAHHALRLAQHELAVLDKGWQLARERLRVSSSLKRWGGNTDPIVRLEAEIRENAAHSRVLAQYFEVQRAFLALARAMGVPSEEVPLKPHEAPAPASGPARALWVWRSPFLDDREERSFFLDFLEARRIHAVFLFVSTQRLLERPTAFRSFVHAAHSRGVSVHALNGEPHWIFPEKRKGAEAFFEALSHYRNAGRPSQRFDAVHLDVEPQALPQWDEDQDELLELLLDFLCWSRDRSTALNLSLAVDLPDWFDRKDPAFLEQALARIDQVVIMAYHGRSSKVAADVQAELIQAQDTGKKVWIGLSADPSHLPASSSIPPEARFESLIREVERALMHRGGFGGVAIHDYDRYRDLILHAPGLKGPSSPKGATSVEQFRHQPSTAALSGSNEDRPEASGKFVAVRLGSYSSESALAHRIQALRRAGWQPYTRMVELPEKGRWRRLYVGRFASDQAALRALQKLEADGFGENAILERLEWGEDASATD